MKSIYTVIAVLIVIGGCIASNPNHIRANTQADELCATIRLATLDAARTMCDAYSGAAHLYSVTCSQKKVDRSTTVMRVSVGIPALFGQIKSDERCAIRK